MAGVVLRVGGALVGSLFGQPALGYAVGGMIADVIAPQAVGEGQTSVGPRLKDLSATQSSYGAVIPYLIANTRVAGNVIWQSDKRELTHTVTSGGGGGGKGGAPEQPTNTVTTYTYEVDMFILLSCNPGQVIKMWANNKLVDMDDPRWRRLTVYEGNYSGQDPDPTYEAAVGVGNAPNYYGRLTVFIEAMDLGESGSIPNLQFQTSMCSGPSI